jgi:hypothetical protein
MAEPLTREQFQLALAEAVTGVLNVYREIDAMFRELSAALGEGEPRLTPLVRKLVPPAGNKNPDARYLRNYHAWVFAPANEMEEEEEDDDEEEGDEEEGEGKKPKRTLAIKIGTGLVIARATVFDRGVSSFEPNFVVGTLLRCRVDSDVEPGTELKIGRGRFRKVLRAIDSHRGGAAKPVQTNVPVSIGNQKNKHKLVFDMPNLWYREPLFDITPTRIHEMAKMVCATMNTPTSTGGG